MAISANMIVIVRMVHTATAPLENVTACQDGPEYTVIPHVLPGHLDTIVNNSVSATTGPRVIISQVRLVSALA